MARVLLLFVMALALALTSCENSGLPTAPADSRESNSPLDARTLQRPISDFIDAQGVTNYWQPYGDEIAWAENPNADPEPDAGWFDWLGFANEYFVANGGPDLGTVISGNVTEKAIAGGRRVHVTLNGTNVMAWAFHDWVGNPNGWTDGPLCIGAYEQDVMDGATPAIGNCHFTWVFTDTFEPGSPLPDLVYTFNVGPWQDPPDIWPYMDWASQLTFNGTAFGPLHEACGWEEGTPGSMHVSQVAHLSSPSHNPNFDGWPCERVDFGPVGN